MVQRRVEKVRLVAPNESLLRRGALLLEDALRTASLPETSPGRVLVFRSLSVGTIRADQPPSSLALTIEKRVQELMSTAVHALDPSAHARDVVFFRDDAEPFVLFVSALASGHAPTQWFWPLAIRGLQSGVSKDEAIRVALFGALESTAGRAAVVRIVAELAENGTLNGLLGALRWQEGPALVRAFGGSVPEPSLPLVTMLEPTRDEVLKSPQLRQAIVEWARAWGPEDARSLWLGAMALAVENPARIADARLFTRAQRVIVSLLRAFRSPQASIIDGDSATFVPQTASEPNAVELPKESAAVVAEAKRSAALENDSGQASPLPATQEEMLSPLQQGIRATEQSIDGEVPTSKPLHDVLSSSPTEAHHAEMIRPRYEPYWPDVPVPTTAGGLLFLIPLFERLGIEELLAAFPDLLDLDFPVRLFLHVAERLGVSRTDPMRLILGAPSSRNDPLSVTLPARFHEMTKPGPMLGPVHDLDGLLSAFHLGARRLSRRKARLGLRDLVLRPGRVTATRTHIDVLFDHRLADVRVRRAGLDVDPGWTTWLGRVVRYHYLYGEIAG